MVRNLTIRIIEQLFEVFQTKTLYHTSYLCRKHRKYFFSIKIGTITHSLILLAQKLHPICIFIVQSYYVLLFRLTAYLVYTSNRTQISLVILVRSQQEQHLKFLCKASFARDWFFRDDAGWLWSLLFLDFFFYFDYFSYGPRPLKL
jgi:hypothetical protein